MIEHMWRVPRRLAHVGIWRAESATALHNAICSLPVRRFTGISVASPFRPLPDHGPRERDVSSTRPIRVGVVGCGVQGRLHLKCLERILGADVVAVCDRDEARACARPETTPA